MDRKHGTVIVSEIGDDFGFKTPYYKPFITKLKRTIPRDLRRWDPDTKEWIIKMEAYSMVLALVFGYFEIEYE